MILKQMWALIMVKQFFTRIIKLSIFISVIVFVKFGVVIAQDNEAPKLDMTVNRGVIKPIS